MNTLNLDAFRDAVRHATPDIVHRGDNEQSCIPGFSYDKMDEIIRQVQQAEMSNAGYTIQDMVRTSPWGKRNEGFALGMNDLGGWVTWCYVWVPGKSPDFFWGHYYGDERTAKADFHRRLAEEFSY